MGRDSNASSSGRRPDILVVEDNPGDIRLIEEAFSDSHLDAALHTVSTGEDALDFVHQRGEFGNVPRPDAVLLDWSLPQTNGTEVLRKLKTDFPDIPVIIMSGARLRTSTIEEDTSQADVFLTKPTEPDAYIDIIRTIV